MKSSLNKRRLISWFFVFVMILNLVTTQSFAVGVDSAYNLPTMRVLQKTTDSSVTLTKQAGKNSFSIINNRIVFPAYDLLSVSLKPEIRKIDSGKWEFENSNEPSFPNSEGGTTHYATRFKFSKGINNAISTALISPDGKGSYYCIDQKVNYNNDSTMQKDYSKRLLEELKSNHGSQLDYTTNAGKIKAILANSYPNKDIKTLRKESGISNLVEEEAIAATQFLIWRYAHNDEIYVPKNDRVQGYVNVKGLFNRYEIKLKDFNYDSIEFVADDVIRKAMRNGNKDHITMRPIRDSQIIGKNFKDFYNHLDAKVGNNSSIGNASESKNIDFNTDNLKVEPIGDKFNVSFDIVTTVDGYPFSKDTVGLDSEVSVFSNDNPLGIVPNISKDPNNNLVQHVSFNVDKAYVENNKLTVNIDSTGSYETFVAQLAVNGNNQNLVSAKPEKVQVKKHNEFSITSKPDKPIEERFKNRVRVIKVDNKGKAVEGAFLAIFRKDGVNPIVVSSTDKKGYLSREFAAGDVDLIGAEGVVLLPDGSYRVEELKAPYGYILNGQSKVFTVSGKDADIKEFKFVNEVKTVEKPNIKKSISRLDGSKKDGTLKLNDNSEPFKYEVTSDVKSTFGFKEFVLTDKVNENLEIVKVDASTSKDVNLNDFVSVHNNVVELKMNSNFDSLENSTVKLSIVAKLRDGLSNKELKDLINNQIPNDATLTFNDESSVSQKVYVEPAMPKEGKLRFTKFGEDADGSNRACLPDARIVIDSIDGKRFVDLKTNAKGSFSPIGSASADELSSDDLGRELVNADGSITLPVGEYIVSEVASPVGYVSLDKGKDVVVSESLDANVMFINRKTPPKESTIDKTVKLKDKSSNEVVLSDGTDAIELDSRDQMFTYIVGAQIADDVTNYESVTIEDRFDRAIDIKDIRVVGVSAINNGHFEKIVDKTVLSDGKTLVRLTLNDKNINFKDIAGSRVNLVVDAMVKADADVSVEPYVDSKVPNKASILVNGGSKKESKEVTVKVPKLKGKLDFTKVGVTGDKAEPLMGATIAFYRNGDSTPFLTLNTNAKGKFDRGGNEKYVDADGNLILDKGVYAYREISAPEGYILNSKLVKFEIKGLDTVSVKLANNAVPTPKKYVEKLQNLETDPLLVDFNKPYNYQVTVDVPKDVAEYKSLELVDQLSPVLDINSAVVKVYDRNTKATTEFNEAKIKTDKNYNKVTATINSGFDGLLNGKTLILEVNAQINKDRYIDAFGVLADKAIGNVATMNFGDSSKVTNEVFVKPNAGVLYIVKKGEDLKPLEGAVFRVFAPGVSVVFMTDANGEAIPVSDEIAKKLNISKDELIASKDAIRHGLLVLDSRVNYNVVELMAPYGYQKMASTISYDVIGSRVNTGEPNLDIASIKSALIKSDQAKCIENIPVPKGFIDLTKTEVSTSEAVAGARITFFTEDGKEIVSGITNAAGKIGRDWATGEVDRITDDGMIRLESGKYYFVESEAPAGYRLNPDKHYFTIEGNKVHKDVLENTYENPEKPEIEKFVSKDKKVKSVDFGEVYQYQVVARLNDVKGYNKVELVDVIEDTLEIVGTPVVRLYSNDDTIDKFDVNSGVAADGFDITVKDNKISAVRNGKFKGFENKAIVLFVDAKIDKAKFQAKHAPETEVPNTATLIVNDGKVKVESNPVHVKPNREMGSFELTKINSSTKLPLAGATVKIYQKAEDNIEKLILSAITDENGKLKSSDKDFVKDGKVVLPVGKYYFKETKAPKGYVLNEEEQSFVVKANENVSMTLTNDETEPNIPTIEKEVASSKNYTADKPYKVNFDEDYTYTVKVKITEDDARRYDNLVITDEINDVLDIVGTPNVKLNGKEIGKVSVNGNKVAATITKTDLAKVKDIKAGDNLVLTIEAKINEARYIKAFNALIKPVKNQAKLKFNDKKDLIPSNEVYVEPKSGKVEFNKFDASTGEAVAGATITFYHKDGDNKVEFLTGTTDAKGHIENSKVSADYLDKDGNLVLPLGEYYFVETNAPEGYKLNDAEHKFSVTEKGITQAKLPNEVIDPKKPTIDKTVGKDDANQAKLLESALQDLIKKDFVYKVTVDISDNIAGYKSVKVEDKLDDALILTRASAKAIHKDGSTENIDSLKVSGNHVILDINNKAEIKNLRGSKVEITILAKVNPDKKDVIKTYDGGTIPNVATLEFNGKNIAKANADVKPVIKKYPVNIEKVDQVGNKVKGATIGIFKENDEKVLERVSGEDGKLSSIELEPGNYYFKELDAPKGYVLNDSKISFKIDLDGNVTKDAKKVDKLVLVNNKEEKPSVVEFTKLDGSNDQPIDGATIELHKENGELILKGVTDKDGHIVVDGKVAEIKLDKGKYYFVETEAPKGYILNEAKQPFEVKGDGKIVKSQIKNTKKLVEVDFKKIDASTSQPVPGATIELYKEGSDKPILSGITNSNGEIEKDGKKQVIKLEIGKYYFVEKNAPDGYILNPEKQHFEVTGKETEIIKSEIKNEKKPGKGVVEFKKTEFSTSDPVEGATIELYKEGSDKPILSGITDKDGYIVSNGEVKATIELEIGKYYFVEKNAPKGYILNPEKQHFTVTGFEKDIIKSEIKNTKLDKPSVVEFTKLDGSNDQPIAGATIELHKENGDLILKGVTDKSGHIIGKDGKAAAITLKPGKYYFVETNAPEGYILNDEKQHFEVIGDGKTVKSDIKNTKEEAKPSKVEFKKTDASTEDPVDGATIELHKENGELILKGVTDKDGHIVVDGKVAEIVLEKGKYYFVEKDAPKGYELNPEKQHFEAKGDGEIVKSEIKNTKETLPTISKTVGLDESNLNETILKLGQNKNFVYRILVKAPTKVKPAQKDLKVETKTENPAKYLPTNSTLPKFLRDKLEEKPEEKLEVKQEVKSEAKEEAKPELKEEKVEEVVEAKPEATETAKDEVKDEVKDEIKEEVQELPTELPSIAKFKAVPGLSSLAFRAESEGNDELVKKQEEEAIEEEIKSDEDSSSEELAETNEEPKAEEIKEEIDNTDNEEIEETEAKPSEEKEEIKEEIKEESKLETEVIPEVSKEAEIEELEEKNSKLEEIKEELEAEKQEEKEAEVVDGNKAEELETKEKEELPEVQLPEVEKPVEKQVKTVVMDTLDPALAIESVSVKVDGQAVDNSLVKIDGNKVVFETNKAFSNAIELIIHAKLRDDLDLNQYADKEIPNTANLDFNGNPVASNKVVVIPEKPEVPEVPEQPEEPKEGTLGFIKVDASTGEPVAGATISIYTDKDQLVLTGVTDAKGAINNAKVEDKFKEIASVNPSEGTITLEEGNYYFKETNAPKGYVLNDVEHPFIIAKGQLTPAKFENTKEVPEVKEGVLSFTKVDMSTSYPVPGATIEFYRENEKTPFITGLTNAAGKMDVATATGETERIKPDGSIILEEGNYFYKETKAPEGYILNDAEHKFSIKNGEPTVENLPNTKEIVNGKLSFTKYDYSTSEPVPGATIAFYKKGETVPFLTGITDAKGRISKEGATGEVDRIQENGEIVLEVGSYYFQETNAPQGYVLNNVPHKFTIKKDEVEPATLANKKVIGELNFNKVDLATGQAVMGATIEFYRSGETKPFLVGVTDREGRIAQNRATGEIERIRSNGNIKLEAGQYYFKETAAPEGYELNDARHNFVINEDGQVHKDTLTNRQKTPNTPPSGGGDREPEKPKPDKPTPDKPTPDKPTPDKPTPDKPTPDKPTPGKPVIPDKPTPDKPVVPDVPTKPDIPDVPDRPTTEIPDNPTPGGGGRTPNKPNKPNKPVYEKPNKPTPNKPNKPTNDTPEVPNIPDIPVVPESPRPNKPTPKEPPLIDIDEDNVPKSPFNIPVPVPKPPLIDIDDDETPQSVPDIPKQEIMTPPPYLIVEEETPLGLPKTGMEDTTALGFTMIAAAIGLALIERKKRK